MLIQTDKALTFEQFLQQLPSEGIYELVNGEIVRVEATRAHKNVARFLMLTFNDAFRQQNLDYFADKDITIRTITAQGIEQGRNPDVSVVVASTWNSNPLSYAALTEPIPLAVEVVSTNWEDDYVDKLDEYQRLGIREYWIVDYLAIASRSFLGNPKEPTVFVHQLVKGKYEANAFKGSDAIVSLTLPSLKITVDKIFAVSGIA